MKLLGKSPLILLVGDSYEVLKVLESIVLELCVSRARRLTLADIRVDVKLC